MSKRSIYFRGQAAACRHHATLMTDTETQEKTARAGRQVHRARGGNRSSSRGRVAGSSFILRIKHEPLAVDHLAVLTDRHVDARAALGLIACGIVSGYSPPCSMVSKR